VVGPFARECTIGKDGYDDPRGPLKETCLAGKAGLLIFLPFLYSLKAELKCCMGRGRGTQRNGRAYEIWIKEGEGTMVLFRRAGQRVEGAGRAKAVFPLFVLPVRL
jgi:hypothetical protein